MSWLCKRLLHNDLTAGDKVTLNAVGADSFLNALVAENWNVVRITDRPLSLAHAVRDRYPNLPADYRQFLQTFTRCANAADNAWFLSEEDFNADDLNRKNTSTFRWNEYEQMSLEAAETDPQEEERIRRFWDDHLPIALAVHSDYAYLALCTASDPFGSIVYGYGPEFEDSASKITDSFTEFVQRFTEIVGHSGAGDIDIPREFRDFLQT